MPVETVSWIAANGAELVFDVDGNDTGYRLEAGPDGRFMPPFELTEQAAAGDAGGWISAAIPQMRTITLPIAVDASSAVLTRLALRILYRLLDPSLGPGQLRITAPGGGVREIVGWYAGGLELDDALADHNLEEYRAALKFRCDALWRDAAETVTSWFPDDPTGGFFPILPVRLAASSIFGSSPVTNVGDWDTQPAWTVHGPASSITIRNMTTNRVWTWSGTLGAGETLAVDTRRRPDTPTPKSVTVNGVNAWAEMTAWDLWPLVVGTNDVRVEADGTSSTTEVHMRWRNRYLGA